MKIYIHFGFKGKKNTNKNFYSFVVSTDFDGQSYVMHKVKIDSKSNNQFFDMIKSMEFAVEQAKILDEEYDTEEIEIVFLVEQSTLFTWCAKGYSKVPYDKYFNKVFEKMQYLPFAKYSFMCANSVAKNYCKEYLINCTDTEEMDETAMPSVVSYLTKAGQAHREQYCMKEQIQAVVSQKVVVPKRPEIDEFEDAFDYDKYETEFEKGYTNRIQKGGAF